MEALRARRELRPHVLAGSLISPRIRRAARAAWPGREPGKRAAAKGRSVELQQILAALEFDCDDALLARIQDSVNGRMFELRVAGFQRGRGGEGRRVALPVAFLGEDGVRAFQLEFVVARREDLGAHLRGGVQGEFVASGLLRSDAADEADRKHPERDNRQGTDSFEIQHLDHLCLSVWNCTITSLPVCGGPRKGLLR